MLTKLESLRIRKKNQGLRRAFQAASERWLGFEEAERGECDLNGEGFMRHKSGEGFSKDNRGDGLTGQKCRMKQRRKRDGSRLWRKSETERLKHKNHLHKQNKPKNELEAKKKLMLKKLE